MSCGFHRETRVSTGSRLAGGVARFEMSRIPRSDMWSVRGIGVAVIVSTSTLARSALSRSFTSTPNRCSSSTTSRPRFAKWMSLCASRWVPITMSTLLRASPSITSRSSAAEEKRESARIVKGNSENRAVKLRRCCSASTVVGTSTATWKPASTALKAARIAISVLPKPTSPQSSRSIGLAACMSALIASLAVSWSGVSSKGNDSSKARCQGVSAGKAIPGRSDRRAWSWIMSAAMSATACCTAAFWRAQSVPPIFASFGASFVPPTYFCTSSMQAAGT
jgi:hypothetical protein